MGYFYNHVLIKQSHLPKRITVWRLIPSHSNHHIYGLQKNVIHTLAFDLSHRTIYCDRHLPCMAFTCLKKPTKLGKVPLPRLWSMMESKLRLRTHCLRYSEILSIILSRCSMNICGRNSPRGCILQTVPWRTARKVLILLHDCSLILAISWPNTQGSLGR